MNLSGSEYRFLQMDRSLAPTDMNLAVRTTKNE